MYRTGGEWKILRLCYFGPDPQIGHLASAILLLPDKLYKLNGNQIVIELGDELESKVILDLYYLSLLQV